MSGAVVRRSCRWVRFDQEETRFLSCPNLATLHVLDRGAVTCEMTCEPHAAWRVSSDPRRGDSSEREHFDIASGDDMKAAMIRLAVAVREREREDDLFAATMTARTLELIEIHRRNETRRHELVAWNKTLGNLFERQKLCQREMSVSAPLTRRHVQARRELAAIQRVLDSMKEGPDS